MNRITLRHALKRIGAGMTAAVTGAVLLVALRIVKTLRPKVGAS